MTQSEPSPGSPVNMLLGPRTLELLDVDSGDSIQVVHEWHRGGAETYVTDFLLKQDGEQKHLIAKACIKFGPREAMDEWLDRRQIMQNNGVQFPELFAVDGATIVEEYIPFEFSFAYAQGNEATRSLLRERFIDTYKRISGAGFSPQSLHDVRSHGDDVVVIDVGEDIGGHISIDRCDLSVVVKAEQSFRDRISPR